MAMLNENIAALQQRILALADRAVSEQPTRVRPHRF
jgi:hypothetical protein